MKGIDYKFKSGKFKDKTVSKVCEINPDYILHIHNNIKKKLRFTMEVINKACYWQLNLK